MQQLSGYTTRYRATESLVVGINQHFFKERV